MKPHVVLADAGVRVTRGEQHVELDWFEAREVARDMLDLLIGAENWVLLEPIGHTGSGL